MRSLTDAELVARAQAGDVAAFNELAARWESALYGFTRRTLGDARHRTSEPRPEGRVRHDRERDPPVGPLGTLVHAMFVRRQLQTIFDYRNKKIVELMVPEGRVSTG